MNISETALDGVLTIEPNVFGDDRGFFFESYNKSAFDEALGEEVVFVQDNHSRSARSVLRGLHYQIDPHGQGKLVRCGRGAVWDVAVDIRRGSPTFTRWFGVELSETNKLQLWVPVGFAHGFVALSEDAELLYKTTHPYAPEADRSLRWNDPEIGVEWPIDVDPILSEKDQTSPLLAEADLFEGRFTYS